MAGTRCPVGHTLSFQKTASEMKQLPQNQIPQKPSLIPALPSQTLADDPGIWISHRPEALLTMGNEALLQQHLGSFNTLAELDAARNELQDTACRGMSLLQKDRVVHGQLLAWPILLQPEEPMAWSQSQGLSRNPSQPDIHDRLLAAWHRLTWTTPVEICRRRVVLPGLIDAELAFDGHPLPMFRAVAHASNALMDVPARKDIRMYCDPPPAVRTARRPFVLLTPAVVFGTANQPMPMLSSTAADCQAFGELIGGLFNCGSRFQQVMVHPPLPWRAAVHVAREAQLLVATTYGLSHGWRANQHRPERVCAPWEQVHYGVRFVRESAQAEAQIENEAWQYPGWWQPSNHLQQPPFPDPLSWVSVYPPNIDGNGQTH